MSSSTTNPALINNVDSPASAVNHVEDIDMTDAGANAQAEPRGPLRAASSILDELKSKCAQIDLLLEECERKEMEVMLDADATEEEVSRACNDTSKMELRRNRLYEMYESKCKKVAGEPSCTKSSAKEEGQLKPSSEWSSFKNTQISKSELPRLRLNAFELVNGEDNCFSTLEPFFEDFERVFRLNQVNLHKHWKDYMVVCLGSTHGNWFRHTIGSQSNISWDKGQEMIKTYFDNPTESMRMFKKLITMGQREDESVRKFTARFYQQSLQAQMADDPALARLYLSALHPSLENNAMTVLISNYGNSFLSHIQSFRQVEIMITDLRPISSSASSKYAYHRDEPHRKRTDKRHSHKDENDRKRMRNGNDEYKKRKDTNSFSDCKYCNKTWFKGHRCMEFLDSKNDQALRMLRRKVPRTISNDDDYEHPASSAWREYGNLSTSPPHNNVNTNIGKISTLSKYPDHNNLLTKNSFSLYTPILLQKTRALGLIDTGADFSVLNKSFLINNKIRFFSKNGLLNLAGRNNHVNRIGVTESIEICYNGKTSFHSFEIMDFDSSDKFDVILGNDILPQLGITLSGVAYKWDDTKIFDDSIDDSVKLNESPAGSVTQHKSFISEITPYLDANQSIPKSTFCTIPESVVHLDTTPGKVVNVRQYPIPNKLLPVLDDAIGKWLRDGVITKAPVNTAWNSPLTLADKKDTNGNKTGKLPCSDPRKINDLLPDDKYPIPLISDIFHKLS